MGTEHQVAQLTALHVVVEIVIGRSTPIPHMIRILQIEILAHLETSTSQKEELKKQNGQNQALQFIILQLK